MLKGKTIILGVTGGIAAYKSADLVSRLKKQNANVEVIMTESAMEFVKPLTFQTMSNNPVHYSMFNEIDKFDVEHISLAKKADMIIIAPASANTIGKIANGIADNLLTTVVMATRAKVLIAPAMNTQMYTNPITQANMEKLEDLGYEFISPTSGRLACGDIGEGKMSEPIDIVDYVIDSFVEKDLVGKKVLVTAGPTRENIDPVRFISNHSTGKMGYAIATQAKRRGADVILISGPTELEKPKGVKFIDVESTHDMFEAIGEYFDDCDILIKSAAPSDYRPENYSEIKIKKNESENDSLTINFVRNPDILKYYGNTKVNQIVAGFAAETNDVYDNAYKKVKNKNLDFIVANDVTKDGAGFGVDTNIVSIIYKDGTSKEYPLMDKINLADIILDEALKLENKS